MWPRESPAASGKPLAWQSPGQPGRAVRVRGTVRGRNGPGDPTAHGSSGRAGLKQTQGWGARATLSCPTDPLSQEGHLPHQAQPPGHPASPTCALVIPPSCPPGGQAGSSLVAAGGGAGTVVWPLPRWDPRRIPSGAWDWSPKSSLLYLSRRPVVGAGAGGEFAGQADGGVGLQRP